MVNKLNEVFKDLSDNFSLFFILPDEKYPELRIDVLKKIMSKSKKKGVYINLNKPYKTLVQEFSNKKVKNDDLFFIDCVDKKGKDDKNVVYMKSLSALTSVGIALDPFFRNKNASFIFIDSIDSLVNANKEKIVIKFLRFIVERARDNDISVVILSLGGNVHKILSNEISVICDKIVYLRD